MIQQLATTNEVAYFIKCKGITALVLSFNWLMYSIMNSNMYYHSIQEIPARKWRHRECESSLLVFCHDVFLDCWPQEIIRNSFLQQQKKKHVTKVYSEFNLY